MFDGNFITPAAVATNPIKLILALSNASAQ